MDENKNTTCMMITEHSRKVEPISYDLIIKDPSLIAKAPNQRFHFYFGKVSLNHDTPVDLGIEYASINAPPRESFIKRNFEKF